MQRLPDEGEKNQLEKFTAFREGEEGKTVELYSWGMNTKDLFQWPAGMCYVGLIAWGICQLCAPWLWAGFQLEKIKEHKNTFQT